MRLSPEGGQGSLEGVGWELGRICQVMGMKRGTNNLGANTWGSNPFHR